MITRPLAVIPALNFAGWQKNREPLPPLVVIPANAGNHCQ